MHPLLREKRKRKKNDQACGRSNGKEQNHKWVGVEKEKEAKKGKGVQHRPEKAVRAPIGLEKNV